PLADRHPRRRRVRHAEYELKVDPRPHHDERAPCEVSHGARSGRQILPPFSLNARAALSRVRRAIKLRSSYL
ncbi:hypothetical protein, partial [Beijerinckia sp. L45]|uniref:hypothetical protein n=1 Tax=Beijerinckia sp. L45 TaxID=1641855 RepID=UPI001AED5E88